MSDATADVIVVGLGAVGSATLHELARRGIRAIGIDRWSPPHSHGSSHGETRITREAIGEGEQYVPLVLRSNAIWRELEANTHQALMLRCGFAAIDTSGGAAIMHGKAGFAARTVAAARAFGILHEQVSPDEFAYRHPGFVLRGDEDIYYEPGGGLLFPERCIAAQLERAQQLGAVVRRNERVLDIETDLNGTTLLTTEGRLAAARVVLTAGGWTPGLARTPLTSLRVLRQVLHWFQPAEPALYAPGRFPTFIWTYGTQPEDSLYGFPIVPGLTPGVKLASEQYNAESDPDHIVAEVADCEVANMHSRHADGRLRGLSRRAIQSSACFYTAADDGDFAIDFPSENQSMLLVSACSGHGFKHSAGVGEHVARLITGEDRVRDEFSLARATFCGAESA